jgi:outer membrane protein OmpA-like peptidoglycan-associated protein
MQFFKGEFHNHSGIHFWSVRGNRISRLLRMIRGAIAGTMVALLVLGALPMAANAVTTSTSGTTVTDTYGYTGSTETLTVPANVTQLTLSVTGAEGAQGGRDSAGTAPPGGYQGVVSGTLAVTPGEVLTIGVGKGGTNSPDWNACTPGANQATGDPNDAVGGTNPLGGFAGGAGGAPGPSGCSGYGGSGGAASVVEVGTSSSPSSVATVVAGGSGGSGGSGQFSPTMGQISLPTFSARSDATSTTGEDGESVYTACHQVTGQQCDGGGGAGGGGGVQGGSNGFVEFGAGTSDEWFGLGGYPGENSDGGLSGLTSQYSYYSNDNANGSVVISYASGASSSPTNVSGAPGNANVGVYWSTPASDGGASITGYVVRYATSPFTSWTTASMCTSVATTCTVTGLTNGSGYEFEVAAVNSLGQSAFSAASTVITPSGPPGSPTISSVTPSDGSLSVAFTGASSSLPILDYQYSLDGGATWISSGVTSSPLVISGLTNGTQYSLEIEGVNAAGDGSASLPSSATPSAMPGAPTITAITPGSDGTSLGVSFVAGYSGGSTISSYQYATSVGAGTTAFGGWTTATGTSSPLTITGLTNGTTYGVEIRSQNSDGYSPASVYVEGQTLTVPDQPVITSLTASDSAIQVAYTPYDTTNDGGSAISGIDYSLDGGTTWISAGTLANPFTISSLSNGSTYNVVLRADNGVGPSAASAPSSATPLTVPGMPTLALVTGGSTSAQVLWSAPSSNGGSPILNYTASAFSASSGGSAVSSCTSSTLTCSVSGLSNDTTYYFSVTATNAAGVGPATEPRLSALPVALPAAPTITSLTAGNAYISAAFNAGTFDVNNPIASYQYSTDGGATWQSASGTTSPMTISGLNDGTAYSIKLRALSVAGAGAASNSESATPYEAPDATANATTSYVAGSGQATVSWLAPNNNGAAISSYTVTAFTAAISGSQASTCTTSSLSCTLSGLSNGTTYYISIQSVNVYTQYSLRSSPRIPVVPGTASSVSLAASPTSSTYGASVTLTATLNSGATGTVNFEEGGTTIGACGAVTIASSSAQCVTTSLPSGTDSLQAYYSGNTTYASSVSVPSSFVVTPATQSSLTLTSISTTYAPSPNNNVALTTTGGSTAGAVTYVVDGAGNSAGCTVNGSSLVYTSAGTCSITATMAGNAGYGAVSSSDTSFSVNQASPSVTLATNPTSSSYGASVTLTATLTSGASGTVDFQDGGVTVDSCGTVTLVSSSAQCVTTDLPGGSDVLQVVYSGDTNFQSATSASVNFAVGLATQAPLVVTSISGTTGFDLTLTSSGGSGTGSVSYVVSNGTATCSEPSAGVLAVSGAGTCIVTATRAGDVNYSSGSSAATTVTFSAVQTLSFTTTPPTHAVVDATYTPSATSTANLTVSVSIDPSSSAVCSLNAGVVTFLAPGNCVLDANQAGDSTHAAATQVQQSIVVAARSVTTPTTPVAPSAPSAPTNVTTTINGNSATVSWSASANDSTVTGYTVTAEPGGEQCTTTVATTCTMTGLSPNKTYTFSVVAMNATGSSSSGSASSSSVATPTISVNASVAVVNWKAPSGAMSAKVDKYYITVEPGNEHCTTSGATTCTISGLPISATFTVKVAYLGSNGLTLATADGQTAAHFAVTTNFAFSSSALTTSDQQALIRLAKRIVKSKIHSLTVLGYTDSVGSASFNEALSSERAKSVGAFLLSQVHRLGDHSLILHESGKGILATGSNAANSRMVKIIS